jgi:formylglycine-generating enzyme required for sulfatase activity
VTFDEYDHFCAATERKKPEDNGWGRRRRPMIAVSWREAVAYCAWLANKTGQPYRLPSEAEWEYAARAGTTTRYAFGGAITPKDANYSESKLGKTTEVGAYSPNAWGLYDMHGNVWEWVEDVWHDSYKGAPNDGSAWTEPCCMEDTPRGRTPICEGEN